MRIRKVNNKLILKNKEGYSENILRSSKKRQATRIFVVLLWCRLYQSFWSPLRILFRHQLTTKETINVIFLQTWFFQTENKWSKKKPIKHHVRIQRYIAWSFGSNVFYSDTFFNYSILSCTPEFSYIKSPSNIIILSSCLFRFVWIQKIKELYLDAGF